jgi:fructokinase
MRIGIDLGGTKIEIIALDGDGAVLLRERAPTPRNDYGAIVRAIAGLVVSAEARLNRTGTVGVGIPGAISPKTGLVKNANTTELIGHPLDKDLGAALSRDVRLDNDANCFALSEAVDGAAAGARVVFGVILGTGVGSGVVVDERTITGRHFIAGEFGHNPLPWPSHAEIDEAPACYCGQRGCVETWVSGTGFAADYLRRTGRAAKGPAIMMAVEAGEPEARAAYDAYVDRLARSLTSVINVLDPDAIVLGGGMGNVDRLYADLPALIRRHVFSDEFTTPIVKPRHGDSSGVRGAAWLWGR